MTTVAPYRPPETLNSVIRLGDQPQDIYVMTKQDEWLEVTTGRMVTSQWLYEVANSGEVDESKPFPWVNRVGLTVLEDNTGLKHDNINQQSKIRRLERELEGSKEKFWNQTVEINRKDDVLANLTRKLEEAASTLLGMAGSTSKEELDAIASTLFDLSCDTNVAISIDKPNAHQGLI